jgi:hypothetical protein
LWDIKEQNEFLTLPEIPAESDNAGEYVIRFLKGEL